MIFKNQLKVKCTIDLIKRVKIMCSAGGFNLMKFICNRKNILMSILDIHRTEVVKNTDLVGQGRAPNGKSFKSKLEC